MITKIKWYAVLNLLAIANVVLAEPVINEFTFNHTGIDTHEYVEIFGSPNTDYSSLTIIEIEGDSTGAGVVDGAFTVGLTDAQGYWTTGFLSNVIENGTVTLLLVENFSGALGDDLDIDNDGVLDFTPWTSVVDAIAVMNGGPTDQTYANVTLLQGFDGISATVGGASRIPNGEDTDTVGDWVRNDFDGEGLPGFVGTPESNEALNTPGTENRLATTQPELPPLINEFNFNHTGIDTHEYVEIIGSPDTNYSNFTVIEIEGDSVGAGAVDGAFTIGLTDAQGYWTTGFLSNVIENGTVTLLLVENFSGALGDDLDIDNDGVLDFTPWTSVVDAIAVLNGGPTDQTYANVTLMQGFDGVGATVGGASRIPNGEDTDTVGDWVRNDFDGEGLPGFVGTPESNEALNTPGTENALAVIEPPAIPLAIYEIQGAGHVSPYVGERVETTGLVTAVRTTSFYLQDIQGDNDNSTSDAIVVFVGANPGVVVGDQVTVVGTVTEFYPGGFNTGNLSTTEIIQPQIDFVSGGHPLPTAVVIGTGGRIPPNQVIDDDASGDVNTTGSFDHDTDGIDFYESLEAMRVQVNNAQVVGSDNFGEIAVVGDNGVNASGLNLRGGITIASDDFNPERIIIDDAIVIDEPVVTVGDVFSEAIIGVMDYSFGNFKLLNTEALPPVIPGGLLGEVTDLVGGPSRLTIASLNVENLDPSDSIDKINGLANEIVNSLRAPDIIGLQEVQDNSGSTDDGVVDASETYDALISAMVAAGGPIYEFRDIAPLNNQDGGQPGGNIRVGFLFQPGRVSFVDRPGADATISTTVQQGLDGIELSFSPGRIDPSNPAFEASRKPLVGEFVFQGEKVFVIVNHFNSKGGDDSLFGRVQPPVLYTEAQRLQQAEVVDAFVGTILALDSNANVVVLGDLNDFPFSAPLTTLAGGELSNLVSELPTTEQYSYIFEGNSQSLDHILVSDNLMQKTQPEFDIVHVNAEFNSSIRPTDHDPLVARFCTDSDTPQMTITVTPKMLWPPNRKYVRVTAEVEVDDQDPDVVIELISVTSSDPDDTGRRNDLPNDIVIIDDFTFNLRAERLSKDGRVYTITYAATDACGNKTEQSAEVRVPGHKYKHGHKKHHEKKWHKVEHSDKSHRGREKGDS